MRKIIDILTSDITMITLFGVGCYVAMKSGDYPRAAADGLIAIHFRLNFMEKELRRFYEKS